MPERLRQLERVGCGSMAEVFRGVIVGERGTRRAVALKRLLPDLLNDAEIVDLFVKEARIAVRLSHPNVVHALELIHDEKGYALICEWLDCASLEELHRHRGTMPYAVLVKIGLAVSNALDYLHSLKGEDGSPLGLIHRDITPANIFVTQDGQIKLGDFGVAWCAADGEQATHVAGTPQFAAPEQLEGKTLDIRADLYGLGTTLMALSDHLPTSLNDVLQQAAALDPKDRHTDSKELARALRKACDSLGLSDLEETFTTWHKDCRGDMPIKTAPKLDDAVQSIMGNALSAPTPDAPLPPPSRRRTKRWSLMGLALATLAAGTAWLTLGRESTPAEMVPTPPTTTAHSSRKRPTITPTGSVNINAVPWAKIEIDGRPHGSTPLRGLSISAGKHVVVLKHPVGDLKRTVEIQVIANRTQTYLFDLRRGTVRKRTVTP